jgi:hypothetical protein
LAILAETLCAGNGSFDIYVTLPYGVFTIRAEAEMGLYTLKGVIRGDVPLARAIFNDPRKRRLIPQLQQDGWPIFDLAGKRSAFPADLVAHARKATRSGPAPRGTAKRKAAAHNTA